MGYTVYRGLPVFCARCRLLVGHFHVLWVNQHGCSIRLFCECGHWTDRRKVGLHPHEARVRELDGRWDAWRDSQYYDVLRVEKRGYHG